MTIITVKIAEIRQETPTVRALKIDLQGQEFNYKSGQWIDCYADIEGKREIVGYSLASSPYSSKEFIELAIKISDNIVTKFIHEEAIAGDILYIEGGQGDIYYEKGMGEKIVLAAAGIGIAPIMGILRYIDEATTAKVTLFQSAPTFNELIYYDEIKRLAESNPRIKYYPRITREEPSEGVDRGRITGDLFDKHDVDWDSLFYLSGPGEMIPDLKSYLVSRGVDEWKIKYEVWW